MSETQRSDEQRVAWPTTASTAMPRSVQAGLVIQWVSVVLIVPIMLIAMGGMRGAPDADSTAVAGSVAAMLGLSLAVLALQVVLLVFTTKGRGWARIGLAALIGGSFVANVISGGPIYSGAFGVLSVVMLFLPSSNAWFAAMRRTRV